MTNGTGLDSAPGVPGFCTSIAIVPAVCASAGLTAVVQVVELAHVVARGVPLKRIVDEELPLPAENPSPCSSSAKLSTAPALTLEGRIASIVGPLVIAIVADADFV